jgi:hypothetical protein
MTFQRPQLSQCPVCKTHSLITIESRKTEHGTRRRKECEHCKHRITTHEVSVDFYNEAKQNMLLVSKLYALLNSNTLFLQPVIIKCMDCCHNQGDNCAFGFPEHDTPDSFDCNHYEQQTSV